MKKLHFLYITAIVCFAVFNSSCTKEEKLVEEFKGLRADYIIETSKQISDFIVNKNNNLLFFNIEDLILNRVNSLGNIDIFESSYNFVSFPHLCENTDGNLYFISGHRSTTSKIYSYSENFSIFLIKCELSIK